MVYTELAPRRQHFTWHQPCNNHRALPVHHFRAIKGYSHSFTITCDMCAVSLLESREQRYNNNNNRIITIIYHDTENRWVQKYPIDKHM